MNPEIAAYKESVCTGKGFHKKNGGCNVCGAPVRMIHFRVNNHRTMQLWNPVGVRLDRFATWGAP